MSQRVVSCRANLLLAVLLGTLTASLSVAAAQEVNETDSAFLATPNARQETVIAFTAGADGSPLQLQSTATNLSFSPEQSIPLETLMDDGAGAKRVIYEEPGVIQVAEGGDCADSLQFADSGNGREITIRGSALIPDSTTHGTVFLSGWRLLYLDENEICDSRDPRSPCYAWQENRVNVDHHVFKIKANIINTTQSRLGPGTHQLDWQARGVLADDNGDDPFGFCYRYITVAWNAEAIDADYRHGNPFITEDDGLETEELFYNLASGLVRSTRALTPTPFDPGDRVALIPRGFQYRWSCYDPDFAIFDSFCPPVDRHLQQLAYKYEQPLGSSGNVDWEMFAIYRDKDPWHEFWHNEYLSAIAGQDVNILHPPFNLAPNEDAGADGCVSILPAYKVVEHEIQDVPFEFAVPVLSAWELLYACDDDRHVADIGAWLFDVDYAKSRTESTGTLRYKVATVFRDNDPLASHAGRYRVSILGFNAPRWTTRDIRFDNGIAYFVSQVPDVQGLVRNDTGAAEYILQASFGGPQSSEFGSYELLYRGGVVPIETLAQQPLELLPGEELYINARFWPQAAAVAGTPPRTAWIDFATSSARSPTVRVLLEGYTQPSSAVGLFTPAQINFGLVELSAGASQPQVATRAALLLSTGTTPLLVQSLEFADPNLGFSYVMQQPPQPPANQIGQALYQIDAGDVAVLEIRFSPVQIGTAQTTLVAETNAGPLIISVTGTGCSLESGCGQ